MTTRKFSIGQAVYYRPERGVDGRLGIYQVIALLPESGGEFKYRIKHEADVNACVAGESELKADIRK
jgi:hypothetical protein